MDINLLAILVAAIISMIVGSIWYSPVLFGNIWMKEAKVQFPKDKSKHQKMLLTVYSLAFVSAIVVATVLSYFIQITDAADAASGAEIGFWAWLGFIFTTQLSAVIWENRSKKLLFISASNMLVTTVMMGIILAVWPN